MEDNEDTFSFDISSTYEESEPLSVGLMNAFDNILNTVLKVAEKFEGLLKMASEAVVTLTSLKLPGNSGSATKSSKSDNQNATKNDLWGVEVPTVNGLTEVAGLGSIKKELYALVVLRRHHPQLFRNRMSCNSILLYGPPGTGKTRLVHGLVAESGAVFYNISAGSLLGPYVGQTEQNIKWMFNHLRSKDEFKILFIDELDGLCRKRTCGENDHTRRVKTELMCELSRTDMYANVIIIGATNCPWDLDPAILRRFQKKVYVPLPDAEERVELFQLLAENTEITNNLDQLKQLIDISEGYSGSDISALVQNALIVPLTELQDTTLWKKTADGFFEPYCLGENISIPSSTETIIFSHLCDLPPCSIRARPIKVEDLITAAKHIQVTVNKTELEKYDNFMNQK